MDAVIQVHPGIVSLEHVANAIIPASALPLYCLGITGPGVWVIGSCLFPCQGMIGHFGPLAPPPLFAPAHPLWTGAQFFQRGQVSSTRKGCLITHHVAQSRPVVSPVGHAWPHRS